MNQTKPRDGRTWPGHIFGGRMRTSTLVLIIAFIAIGWLYETYEPKPNPPEQVPASEVVPPGFIPDPAYTWAPRTDVQRHTPTPTTTETTETTPTTPASSGAPTTTPTTPGAPASTPNTPSATTTPVAPIATTTAAPTTPAPTSLPPVSRPTAPLPAAPTP